MNNENERKIKLPFIKDGKEEITLPDLTDTTMREHLDLLTIRLGAEQHLKTLGFPKPKDDDEAGLKVYKSLRAWEVNFRIVTYVLQKIDPTVQTETIDAYAKDHTGWLGEMIIKMYPETEKEKEKKEDFQEAVNPPSPEQKKEPSKK